MSEWLCMSVQWCRVRVGGVWSESRDGDSASHLQ